MNVLGLGIADDCGGKQRQREVLQAPSATEVAAFMLIEV